MATHFEFGVEPHAFPFASVFEAYPAATIELERLVPTNESVVSYVWLRDIDSTTPPDLDGSHPESSKLSSSTAPTTSSSIGWTGTTSMWAS